MHADLPEPVSSALKFHTFLAVEESSCGFHTPEVMKKHCETQNTAARPKNSLTEKTTVMKAVDSCNKQSEKSAQSQQSA